MTGLSARLHDAVDGPGLGLDAVVGEDPAAFDLPALSARIRRRRRARITVLSAVGVATAGAVAFAGPLVVGGWGAHERPAEPAAAAVLPAAGRELCGSPLDVAAQDATSRLVPLAATLNDDGNGNLVVADGGNDLGALAGQRVVASVVASEPGGVAAGSLLALTSDGTVVALGELQPDTSGGLLLLESQTKSYVDPVVADLAPCPTSQGTPDRVPSGEYTAVYLKPAPTGTHGLVQAAPDALTLTLLDQPAPVTGLPDDYPADEVPVVGGTLLGVSHGDYLAPDGWQVQVAVDGDDGLTRASLALKAAGARSVDMNDRTLTYTPVSGTTNAEASAAIGSDVVRMELVLTFQVTAETASWQVQVTSREDGGQTILTYQLTPR